MSDVSLVVRGREFLGWKNVSIQRSLDALCGTFDLSFTDAWNFDGQKWYLVPGDEVRVLIGSDEVLSGYIDRASSHFNASDRIFSVGGRDKTQDLVDCSASVESFVEFKNVTIEQMARTLTKPFGIQVVSQIAPTEKFERVAINNGEKVFNVLDRLAKQRGVLMTTDEMGRLVLTSLAVSKSSVALIEGENILSASINLDDRSRYSVYYVYGQSKGSEFLYGDSATQPFFTARDSAIKRFRPNVIVNESGGSTFDAQKRAQWEAAYNAAQGAQISVSVNNWRKGPSDSDGLWKINETVEVIIPSLNFNGELLIQGVNFSLDESGGQITNLVLTRKDAWVPQPDLSFEEDIRFDIGEIVD